MISHICLPFWSLEKQARHMEPSYQNHRFELKLILYIMNYSNHIGFDSKIKNHQRKCCSRIYSPKQNPSGVWWNNAEGKVICTVQVSNSLLLQCIKCISGRCIAAYSLPSHLWPGGWPPPCTGTPPHFVTFSAIHLCAKLGLSLDSSAENWPMRYYWHLLVVNKGSVFAGDPKFQPVPNLFLDSLPNWTWELKIYIEHPPGN